MAVPAVNVSVHVIHSQSVARTLRHTREYELLDLRFIEILFFDDVRQEVTCLILN